MVDTSNNFFELLRLYFILITLSSSFITLCLCVTDLLWKNEAVRFHNAWTLYIQCRRSTGYQYYYCRVNFYVLWDLVCDHLRNWCCVCEGKKDVDSKTLMTNESSNFHRFCGICGMLEYTKKLNYKSYSQNQWSLCEELLTFMIISGLILFKLRNVSNKNCIKNQTHTHTYMDIYIYKVIHKSLRNFRTRLSNNQERQGRKEHINR